MSVSVCLSLSLSLPIPLPPPSLSDPPLTVSLLPLPAGAVDIRHAGHPRVIQGVGGKIQGGDGEEDGHQGCSVWPKEDDRLVSCMPVCRCMSMCRCMSVCRVCRCVHARGLCLCPWPLCLCLNAELTVLPCAIATGKELFLSDTKMQTSDATMLDDGMFEPLRDECEGGERRTSFTARRERRHTHTHTHKQTHAGTKTTHSLLHSLLHSHTHTHADDVDVDTELFEDMDLDDLPDDIDDEE